MRQLGLLLLLFGIGSSVLHFLEMEFRLLGWIENWGPTVGWCIRGGMALLGVILFMLGKPKPK